MAEYFFVLFGGRIASMLTNKTPQFFFISMHVQKNLLEKTILEIFSKLVSLNKFFFQGEKNAYLESAGSI